MASAPELISCLVPTFFSVQLSMTAALFLGLLLPVGPLSAAVFSPAVPRPADISPADWERLFRGTPQIIGAHLVTAKGVSCYEFVNWDPSPERHGLGGARTYVQVKNRHVTVPWRFQPFGNRRPPWASLGLTEQEAVEMIKQAEAKRIELIGLDKLRADLLKAYVESATLRQHFDIDLYYPERIGADKELDLLPPDFVPPPLSEEDRYFLKVMLGQEKPRPRFTKEQGEAIFQRLSKISKKLSELVRADALGDKKAMDQADRALDELIHPELFYSKPWEQNASWLE